MTTRIAAPALSLLAASSLVVACSDPPQVIQIPFQNTNVLVERSDCAPNTNCVGAIKSKVDNPTLSFDLTLRNVVTNLGTFPEERIQTATGYTNVWFDITSSIDFGATAAGGNGLPLGRALTTVNDQLYPGLTGIGDWVAGDGAPLNFEVHGARLGYQPQRVRFTRTDADTGASAAATTTFVQLDPSVDLVPIQVVVLYSKDHPLLEARLPAQLAFWDQVALSTSYSTSNLGPLRRYTTRTLTPTPQRVDVPAGVEFLNRISPVAYPGTYVFQNALTPDAQWRDCGVQFRLVNYVEIEVPNKNTAPRRLDVASDNPDFWPTTAAFNSPCAAAGNIADASNLVDTKIPTLIFMKDPTFATDSPAPRCHAVRMSSPTRSDILRSSATTRAAT